MEVSGRCNPRDVFAETTYPVGSRILLVPLNEEERNCWLKFKMLAKYQFPYFISESEIRRVSIDLDHPFVPVVSDFAVAAFNELCGLYVKKDVKDNIYEAEVTNVNYLPKGGVYLFYIRLEAMEEDVAGVYEATVLCDFDDGRRTLIKFNRSTCALVGRKLIGMADLIREKSMSEALTEQKKAIKAELKLRCHARKGKKRSTKSSQFVFFRKDLKAVKGKKRSQESSHFVRLKKDLKAVKAACRLLNKYAHLAPIEVEIKRSNPDNWFTPSSKFTGLQPRSDEHSCRGYDYHNPLTVFSCYLLDDGAIEKP